MQAIAQTIDPQTMGIIAAAIGAGYLLEKILPFLKTSKSEPENGAVARKRIGDLCESMDKVVGGLAAMQIHFDYNQKTQDRMVTVLEGIRANQSTHNGQIEEMISAVHKCQMNGD